MLAAPLLLALAAAPAAASDGAAVHIRDTLGLASFKRADVDLNRDGRREVLVYATDRDHCGSGGCTLFVLSPRQRGFRTVMRASVSRLPVTLLPTSTRGWRDLGVTVSGGGIPTPYLARLRFDGFRYPGNPTVAPALPQGSDSGRTLISE